MLNLTSSGLGQADNPSMKQLSAAISRQLGSVQDLRLADNELRASADALAPICMLRNLKTLSLERNVLTELPSLIGTTQSLRRLSLHSNRLTELTPGLCLLVSLEHLDVHKNMITFLPSNFGQLQSLVSLELSENKLVELPHSFCDLSDSLKLSIARNPLERPSMEQTRQGIGAIRRFFGYTRKNTEQAASEIEAAYSIAAAELEQDEAQRPLGPANGESRHDWAGPAGVLLLFNCAGCAFLVEGDVDTFPPDGSNELTVEFNLQTVGRVRPAGGEDGGFADRVQFSHRWLPWRSHEADMRGAWLTFQLQWSALGKEHSAVLLAKPWLAYGCSVGARVKKSIGYATVCGIRGDDQVDLMYDNMDGGEAGVSVPQSNDPGTSATEGGTSAAEGAAAGATVGAAVGATVGAAAGATADATLDSFPVVETAAEDARVVAAPATTHPALGEGAERETVDPRPDTVHRAVRFRYKTGVRIMLLREGAWVDAQVEEYFGLREGSKHRVRLGATRPGEERVMTTLDLNESNHGKLLFPSMGKYAEARAAYCKDLIARHGTMRDEVTHLASKPSPTHPHPTRGLLHST